MARTSAKAKKQRQEANRNRDKGEESADSLPSDNQENIENGAQKEKPSRKAIKTEQEQEDSDFENDVSDSEKKGKKRGKVENAKRKEKKLKKEKSVSEDEDETSKNDYENDVSDSEKKGKKRIKAENSKSKEKKIKAEKVESADEEEEEASPTADYDVEKIVEVHHKKNGKREFLIRWKGFSSKDDTWEPEEHLDCPALIDRFMAKVDKAKNLSVRELRDQRTRTQRFTPIVPGVRSSHRNQGKARTVFYAE